MKSRCSKKTAVFVVDSSLAREQKMFKVMKERVRRARISKSLEELKLLILGESSKIFRLDQADILEFTVKHLRRLHRIKDGKQLHEKYHGGKEMACQVPPDDTKNTKNQQNTNNSVLQHLKPSNSSINGPSSKSDETKDNRSKLTALRISIPPTENTLVNPGTKTTRQAGLLVPLYRESVITKSVGSQSTKERKPLQELNCNLSHNVLIDPTLWRPWN